MFGIEAFSSHCEVDIKVHLIKVFIIVIISVLLE